MPSSARIRALCAVAVAGALVVAASWTADAGRRLSRAGQEAAGTLSAGFAGWESVTDPPAEIGQVCSVRADGVIVVAGSPIGYIATTASHHDFRLHAEWRWAATPGNSGVLVHISAGPKDRQWPVCFQVQWKNTAVGDLLPIAGASFAEALSTPPGAKTPQLNHSAPGSERPIGEWNACDVVCRATTATRARSGSGASGLAQRSCHRQGVNDVAEGAELDEEYPRAYGSRRPPLCTSATARPDGSAVF
jgi:hypothetical protein